MMGVSETGKLMANLTTGFPRSSRPNNHRQHLRQDRQRIARIEQHVLDCYCVTTPISKTMSYVSSP